MNAITKRIALVALVAVTVTGFSVDLAHAAIRDAGAKARGEFGTGFHNPKTRGNTARPSNGSIWRSTAQPRLLDRKSTMNQALPSAASPLGTETSPVAVIRESNSPTLAVSPVSPRTNRVAVNRGYRGTTSKRHNHLYRKLHPGTGFWN